MTEKLLENQESIITRHADKGTWKLNPEELKSKLTAKEFNLVMSVLENNFPEVVKLGEVPLKLDGIIRSLRLADNLYAQLPKESILVVMDSGKDRTQLTRHLATARLAQLEAQGESQNKKDAKRIDMLEIDSTELVKLLADAHPDTWKPYAEMTKGPNAIDEMEALLQYFHAMNKSDVKFEKTKLPKEAAERYKQFIELVHSVVTKSERPQSDQRQSPVILFAVGHSGPLGQMSYEKQQGQFSIDEVPHFCEEFHFDKKRELVGTEKIKL
ncbi:MAG TPA: hypothetical protein DCS28_00065 [Candidatus Moranbacteria bacterium]|nr:hypothetical protein [Candidatus Moranbacteria bacterium]HAT74429.1 hypothetical protein [Candidatus Moranbacteria bacterium]